MKKTAIQSFILYTDVRPVLDLVPQEDGLQLLKAIFDYAAGEEVGPFQNIITEKIWEMIRQKLEVGREKAIKRSETNRQNIKSRWDKEPNTTVYDGIQEDTTVYDSKKSYTKGATEQNSTVQYCDSTELSQVHVQVQNKDNTDSANAVFDPVEGGPAGASAAGAAPRPALESDLFTLDQLSRNVKRNKIDLSADGIRAFLEDMHADGWTMYGKPVEKKTITRVLREYAKRHAEYSIEDLKGQEEEARAADRAERIRKTKREREEAEAREKAETEEKKRREREAEAKRKQEESERPQRFKELLPVAKKYCRPDKIPEALRGLMNRDGIPEYAIMAFCGAKDFFPADMPTSEHPKEFIDGYCIQFWDNIRDAIRKYTEVTGIEF